MHVRHQFPNDLAHSREAQETPKQGLTANTTRGNLHCSSKGPSLYCLWGTVSETQAAPTKASRVKCFSTSRKRTCPLAADRWFAAFRIQRRGAPAASAHYCAAAVVVPHRQYRLGP